MVDNKLRDFDKLSPIEIRRRTGKYFTNADIGVYISGIIWNAVRPDHILEPFVGGGSLIIPFFQKDITLTVNDIEEQCVELLKQQNNYSKCVYRNEDFFAIPVEEILSKWNIPVDKTKKLLVYSNPPFGTAATNRLVLKREEINGKKSRKIKINYHGLNKLYGSGDLVIPAIGKMIEVIKARESGFLGFFSPFGIFCERMRYNKLLVQILKNFDFIYGEIFSGEKFHGVSKNKPISFSLWKYKKWSDLDTEDLSFFWQDKLLGFKRTQTIIESWRYDTREIVTGEIGAQGNERFNSPVPKILHVDLTKGGSELDARNVVRSLGIDNIPDELIYGLWSITVGNRAIIKHPLYIDNAYTHLPDFSKKETQEILTYAIIHTLIVEKKNNYTKGRIGFSGPDRDFKFGDQPLTDGVKHLISQHGDCLIGKMTISEFFDRLKNTDTPDKVDKNVRKEIRSEISTRLDKLGYWGYIPLPRKRKTDRLKNFF
ncbi:MAG: hypothetical protein ACTSP4_08245 [Candidatus Hodarchaeales archaeon]